MYIQLYPFSKLSYKEIEYIKSKDYFDEYINNGKWATIYPNYDKCSHYYMKDDGSFRNVFIVSPIIYIIIHCFSLKVSDYYKNKENFDKMIFYQGNIEEGKIYYAESYDKFVKYINFRKIDFKYFIKFDIKDFYNSINRDKLFNSILNIEELKEKKDEIELIKKLLLTIGERKFPTVEFSTGLSYLASIVYLDDLEDEFINYIRQNNEITNFHIVRYVDDTYILFNINKDKNENAIFNEFFPKYNSILREKNLTLNSRKCFSDEIEHLSSYLKQAFYDEEVNEIKYNLEEEYGKALLKYLQKIDENCNEINLELYIKIVDEIFKFENLIFQPQEILTILSIKKITKDKDSIINLLNKIILKNNNILRIDPKRMTRIILNTYDGQLIRNMLNRLFEISRNGLWTDNEMCSLIQYLTMRGFNHPELLEILEKEDENLFRYYKNYCKDSKWIYLNNSLMKIDKIFTDHKIIYLYMMYILELKSGNILDSFANYKSFFDRFTAWIAFLLEIDKNWKKTVPNINKYYKKIELKKVYKDIDGYEEIIDDADKLRNQNPLNHASGNLLDLDLDARKIEVTKTIADLNYLLKEKINKNF